MSAINERQRARFYIYENKINFLNLFKIQKERYIAKSNTISLMFLYTKSQTPYLKRFFVKFLKLAFIYKKHDTLCYGMFLYTKILTLRKKQDNLRYVFMLKNPDTLHYAIFHWIFEICAGGWKILIAKNNALCVTFLYAKNNALWVTFLYQKCLCIVLIPNYKRTYDQSDHIKK